MCREEMVELNGLIELTGADCEEDDFIYLLLIS